MKKDAETLKNEKLEKDGSTLQEVVGGTWKKGRGIAAASI